MRIYLDHNAGAQIRPEARTAMERLFAAGEGNPASVHQSGQRARRALEHARECVASLIGASARQIVFSSGGTESNNLAIFGAARAIAARSRIITSAIEHSSIMAPVAELAARGYEVIRIVPDKDGRISPDAVIEALDHNTAIVTLGLANAEIGTIQELLPLAAPVVTAGALFHVDAAQAVGRIPVRVADVGCDLITLSGHKIGAPPGIGALYVRDADRLAPMILGGPHEGGLRAGTPNVMGAVGFGAAAKAVETHFGEESSRVEALARTLLDRLRDSIPGVQLNGPLRGRIPNTLNLTFPGVLGESMLIALDLEGVEVSMGSACAAGAVEPSHVLLAMGRSPAQARSSLRLSLGWSTTAAEIDRAAEIIFRVWRRVCQSEPMEAAQVR
jgi:cysteine desulfurase